MGVGVGGKSQFLSCWNHSLTLHKRLHFPFVSGRKPLQLVTPIKLASVFSMRLTYKWPQPLIVPKARTTLMETGHALTNTFLPKPFIHRICECLICPLKMCEGGKKNNNIIKWQSTYGMLANNSQMTMPLNVDGCLERCLFFSCSLFSPFWLTKKATVLFRLWIKISGLVNIVDGMKKSPPYF